MSLIIVSPETVSRAVVANTLLLSGALHTDRLGDQIPNTPQQLAAVSKEYGWFVLFAEVRTIHSMGPTLRFSLKDGGHLDLTIPWREVLAIIDGAEELKGTVALLQ